MPVIVPIFLFGLVVASQQDLIIDGRWQFVSVIDDGESIPITPEAETPFVIRKNIVQPEPWLVRDPRYILSFTKFKTHNDFYQLTIRMDLKNVEVISKKPAILRLYDEYMEICWDNNGVMHPPKFESFPGFQISCLKLKKHEK